MRFHHNGDGTIGSSLAAWRLLLVLLSLSVARHGAVPTESENLLPSGHPESPVEDALPEDPWGWSAGGWLSFGGWSSSWRSMVSGTRSMFKWRFGNVPPEDVEEGTVTAEGVTEEVPPGPRCEELTLDICRELGYNETSMPNLLNHESQDIARVELRQYMPWVQVNCSADMTFFLCALHAPRCTEVGGRVIEMLPPCRSLCERIKSRCNVVMEKFLYTWPTIFECSRFPEQGEAHCTGQ
ncbi:frizzled-1-like [Hetaerina americana]|uniref:frizzled-1-like n=1 Tax=Hetaerina americana TaxID=62018 RepID=UPI003A7F5FB7